MKTRNVLVEVGDFGHVAKITYYVATDGSEFRTPKECQEYEKKHVFNQKWLENSISKHFNFMEYPIPQITKMFYNKLLIDSYIKLNKLFIWKHEEFEEGEICFLVYKVNPKGFTEYEIWKEEYAKKYFSQLEVLKDFIYGDNTRETLYPLV